MRMAFFLLVVVLIINVNNLFAVDAEGKPPVACYLEAPAALPITGQGHVWLVIQNVIGSLGLSPAEQLAAHDDAALGEYFQRRSRKYRAVTTASLRIPKQSLVLGKQAPRLDEAYPYDELDYCGSKTISATKCCTACRAWRWQPPPSRNRQKTRPSSGLTAGVASESKRPKTV